MKQTIFLLGDNISMYYNPYLIPMTSDRYNWLTKAGREEAMKNLDLPIQANGGNSGTVVSYIREEEERGWLNYDYLVLNCGLHDIAYDPGKETRRVEVDDYRNNLIETIEIVQRHGIKVIWVNTTPVDDERHNARSFQASQP